eukprot:SAG31_NODE_775_length_12190_cov_5.764866_1_plen_128_part_00
MDWLHNSAIRTTKKKQTTHTVQCTAVGALFFLTKKNIMADLTRRLVVKFDRDRRARARARQLAETMTVRPGCRHQDKLAGQAGCGASLPSVAHARLSHLAFECEGQVGPATNEAVERLQQQLTDRHS